MTYKLQKFCLFGCFIFNKSLYFINDVFIPPKKHNEQIFVGLQIRENNLKSSSA